MATPTGPAGAVQTPASGLAAWWRKLPGWAKALVAIAL